ncbi:hypothetical protein KZ810_02695 [Sphingomonas sp. RHCKR47]|uniref:hypothetical protein n=1 Tax=Sphingomonas citricola TaxID=2862498 RepID=UPI001CA5BADB|nr:hypothetical protein [Sphingomonas citricola]MBW6522396.1 hypothetical protein [Sphingomonas citricola]
MDVPLPISVGAWLFCLACLAPAVWRLVRRRARSLDPIWGVVFLLVVNRLTFLAKLSPLISHSTAVALALVMSALTISYQWSDR